MRICMMCLNNDVGAISQLFLLLRTTLGMFTLWCPAPASCCSQFSLETRSVPLLDRAHTFRRPIRVTTRRKAEHSALRISQFAHERLQLSRTVLQPAWLRPLVPAHTVSQGMHMQPTRAMQLALISPSPAATT